MLSKSISDTSLIYFIIFFLNHLFRANERILRKVCYAKSLQSCPTRCDPIDGSPPGSAVPGILQARTLEWVAIFRDNERILGR